MEIVSSTIIGKYLLIRMNKEDIYIIYVYYIIVCVIGVNQKLLQKYVTLYYMLVQSVLLVRRKFDKQKYKTYVKIQKVKEAEEEAKFTFRL